MYWTISYVVLILWTHCKVTNYNLKYTVLFSLFVREVGSIVYIIICSYISIGDSPSSHNYSTLRCREDFFCDSDNLCKPICGSWTVYSSTLVTRFYAIEIICAVIGSISSIAVFVITSLHFKKV